MKCIIIIIIADFVNVVVVFVVVVFIIIVMSPSLLVTFNVQWLIFVPTTLTLKINSVLSAHRVYICSYVDVRTSCDYFTIRH
jgi:hypothetical protein